MSKATTRTMRTGVWILWLVLLLVPSARVDAAVSVGSANGADSPDSVLSTHIIIEDDEPIGSAWRMGGQPPGGHVLNPDGHLGGDGEPSIVLHPWTRTAVAVWADHVPGGYDIVVSYFTSGAWTQPTVLVGSAADELDPFLVIDPSNGSVHLLYWVHDAGPRVMHRQAPADLSGWSVAEQVSGPAEIAVRPAAVFAQGALQVVYERHDLGYNSTPRQIVLATKAGAGFDRVTLAATPEALPNWPEVHGRNGKLWVDWIHGQGAMGWTVLGPAGWGPIQLEPISGTEDQAFRVRGRIRLQALE